MNRFLLTGVAMLVCLPSMALAQTAPATSPKGTTKAPGTASTMAGSARQKLTATLQQAGFTNVTVVPDSFIVTAKDKSGDPVTMFLDSNSMMVVASADSTGDGSKSLSASADQQSPSSADGMFTTIPAKDELSSKLVGLDIYNSAKQNIGAIKDIAFSQNGTKAYIIGVGGFLGMGEHYVAVRPSAITLTYNASEKKWHAEMDANADQLKAAPEYKYAS